MNSLNKTVYLIGFMGVGKTTVSKYLSVISGAPEIDTDAGIIKKEGMSIPKIFEKYGEDYFRDAETALLEEIVAGEPMIVSCGGGMVLREQNRALMKKNGTVIYLTAKPETIFARVRHGKERPLLNGHMNVEYISMLMDQRKERYEKAMDLLVETDGKSGEQLAKEILEMLK